MRQLMSVGIVGEDRVISPSIVFRKYSQNSLKVNYDLSEQALIRRGNYGHIDTDITSQNFPTQRIGIKRINFVLLHARIRFQMPAYLKNTFGGSLVRAGALNLNPRFSTSEILAELDRIGLRPAEFHELLTFGYRFPEILKRMNFVLGFGTIGRSRDGLGGFTQASPALWNMNWDNSVGHDVRALGMLYQEHSWGLKDSIAAVSK